MPGCCGKVKIVILSVLILRYNPNSSKTIHANKRSTAKDIALVMVFLLFQKLNDGMVQEPKKYIEYYVVLDNGEVITSDKYISQNYLVHNLLCEEEMPRPI